MNIRLLEDIGLTAGETKVYTTLLKLGPSKTGPIAKESKVSSSKVYKILDRLEKKGLVGHGLLGKTKQFRAIEPRAILRYMDEKEEETKRKRKEIEKIIPELELQERMTKESTRATMYEGIRSIKNIYNNLIEELNSGEEYLVINATYGKEIYELRSFFQNYHTRRAKKKIKVKILAKHTEKGKLVSATIFNSEIRYLPEHMVTNMITIIYRNKTFFFFLTDDPKGFLIEDREFADSYRKYFGTFWKIAEK